MIIGLVSFSQGSEEVPLTYHDSEYMTVEEYNEFVEAEEAEEEEEVEASQVESPELTQDEFQDASSQVFDTQEESEDAFEETLRKAFKTWNADVRACDADEACLARVNNVLRPMVNEAADNGVLSVIDPCEDRVGTYEAGPSRLPYHANLFYCALTLIWKYNIEI